MNATVDISGSLTPLVSDLVAPISRPIGSAWHVAWTDAGWEGRAGLGIAALGFPIYEAKETVWVRHARRRERRQRQLFTRYVFVRFDPNRDPWGAILDVKGVAGLLCCDPMVPSRVPDVVIEKLRRAEAAGAFDQTRGGLIFVPGDAVQVEDGPFSGMIGEVRRADSKARVDILLRSLGTVALPVTMVAKLDGHDSSASRGVGR